MDNHQTSNAQERDIYNITRLNREVRAVLEGSFPSIWVQGEISNLARPASGHFYFSLKDHSSQVRCAMFKNRNRSLKFAPENGMQVLARASVSLYEGRGEFQLIIEYLEPAGAGALQRAFEELKQRLQREGLFNEDHKKTLPRFPRTIGVITSPTGAAIRDILIVLKRRYPGANVIIYPVPVQGEGAPHAIAGMLRTAEQRREADVLILSRGGGSLEDLWAFNEEVLARALYACAIPVVTGVGHEIDFTIADFCADQRAPTPSAAAELVSPDQTALLEQLHALEKKLATHITHQLRQFQQLLTHLEKRFPHPIRQLQNISQRMDDLSMRLQQSIKTVFVIKHSHLLQISSHISQLNPLQTLRTHRDRCRLAGARLRHGITHALHATRSDLERLAQALNTVSPLATLERGYAIVTTADNKIVRDPGGLASGDTINTRLAKGRIRSTVNEIIDEDK